ncbi:inositol-trisphosphate 3-kinase A-like [Ambystoma mexicanum]|uniref:inositol-trisphosphate 3-kinase A-like n=1 Tax=Ambystoma mexicanum TaxID=8296 RepID=UPI0037E7683F
METVPCFEGMGDAEIQVTPQSADVLMATLQGNGLREHVNPSLTKPNETAGREEQRRPMMANLITKTEPRLQNVQAGHFFQAADDAEVQVTPQSGRVCMAPPHGNGLGEPMDPSTGQHGKVASLGEEHRPNMAKLLMKTESRPQNMETFSKHYRPERAAASQHQHRSPVSCGKDEIMDPLDMFNRDLLTRKKLLRSSDRSVSSTSTCSSVYSSPESDEVFSDDEDKSRSKRKLFRKTKSWKTFSTMFHWALRRQNSWVQLAGHEGNFKPSERGQILKKFSQVENTCLEALMEDALKPYVPTYYGVVEKEKDKYIQMEDLLRSLESPSIMDCKMGVRTYLEEELAKALQKPTLRSDMYQKMVKVDPTAPTEEEHAQQATTKPRYMQWRESISSTTTVGFRIEGIMMEGGGVQRDFKQVRSKEQIIDTFLAFTRRRRDILITYLNRLRSMREVLQHSKFFQTHEVIGSSLLFVHDKKGHSNIWMIDFGKTLPAPPGMTLQHDIPWEVGNHEDGYLFGLENLTQTIERTIEQLLETNDPLPEPMEQ